jgi:hypothetical protein
MECHASGIGEHAYIRACFDYLMRRWLVSWLALRGPADYRTRLLQ